MAIITEAEALAVVSLASMKDELRIPSGEVSHDALITSQLVAAVSYVKQSTGLPLADLPPLRAAIVTTVRDAYDGNREIGAGAAANSFLGVYRSYKVAD